MAWSAAASDVRRRMNGRPMLDRVGLKGFGDRQVTALSGGQRQRVAIARCLVLEPTLVLLDEPLGALDLKLREHMKIELKQLQGTFNTTFAYITHDQSEALVMSDRIAVMNQGQFEQVGSPRELYHNPETPFVASFVGETNRWQGVVASASNGGVTVRLPSGVPSKAKVQFQQPEGRRFALRGPKRSRFRPTRWPSARFRTASKVGSQRSCSTAPIPASSSTPPASNSPFAPCCLRPGPSRASKWARRSIWAGRPMP